MFRKTVVLALIAVMALTICSCSIMGIFINPFVGTWEKTTGDVTITLVFKDDKTLTMTLKAGDYSITMPGTYTYTDTVLTMSYTQDSTTVTQSTPYKISGNTLELTTTSGGTTVTTKYTKK